MTLRFPTTSRVLGLLSLSLGAAATLLTVPYAEAQGAEREKLATHDGVSLSTTYYPSQEEKEATPVVLLHDYKDTQGIFSSLAKKLQSPGVDEQRPSFAVLTVDLRGHGASTQQTAPNGTTRVLDAAKLERQDMAAMSVYDLETVRHFLVGENDAKRINLNELCLVGAGMGATVAVNWAARDWVAPPLLVGKQGQDVKALVLISPSWRFRGVSIQQAMRVQPMKQRAAWMIVYGDEDAEAVSDARRIVKQLDRFHDEEGSLREVSLESSLQGSSLFSQIGEPLEEEIIAFLTEQVANSEQFPWSQRRNRLD